MANYSDIRYKRPSMGLKKGNKDITEIKSDNDDLIIETKVSDKDIHFKGSDDGSVITALTLDMSDGGSASFNHNVTVGGNLTVNGTTTTVNSTTLTVDDKNIELGSTASPSDTSADGGGITLKGATDHTFNWVNSTDAWTSSEHINLASGKEFKINGTSLKDVSETLTNKTIDASSNTITGISSDLVNDTTPQLGGNLDLNSNNITGTGSISCSGDLTVDTNTLYVDATNNRVGIGTSSPSRSLTVRRTAGSQASGEIYADDGTQWYQFNSNNGAGNFNSLVSAGDHSFIYSNGTQNTGSLVIGPWASSAIGIKINSSGNVGIGTSSPSSTLDVLGNMELGASTTEVRSLEIGIGRTGDGASLIDLTGDTTYSDYGARFMRVGGANSNTFIRHRGTGNLVLDSQDAGAIVAQTNSSERMRIDSSGNVGIGTSSPTCLLDIREDGTGTSTKRVQANIDLSAGTNLLSTDPTLFVQQAGTGGAGVVLKTGTIDFALRLDSSGNFIFDKDTTERMRIDSSGNVGIGTSSPSEILHAVGNIRASTSLRAGTSAEITGSGSAGSRLYSNSPTGGYLELSGTPDFVGNFHAGIRVIRDTVSAYKSALTFYTENKATGNRTDTSTEKMRIDSSGNVGIGTSSPSTALDVNGTVTADGLTVAGTIDATSHITTTGRVIAGDTSGSIALTPNDGYGNANLTFNHEAGTPDSNGNAARIEVNVDSTSNAYIDFELKSNVTSGSAVSLTQCMRIEEDGDVHANGDVIAYSTTISDIALKSDIEVIPNALDKVNEIRGVTFTRHNGRTGAGIIAQELEKVLPQAVKEKLLPLQKDDNKKYKTVEYDSIHGLLIEAIKELSKKVEQLEKDKT